MALLARLFARAGRLVGNGWLSPTKIDRSQRFREWVPLRLTPNLEVLPWVDDETGETDEIRSHYRKMLKDPVVESAMEQTIGGVASLDPTCIPGDPSSRGDMKAEFCLYALEQVRGGLSSLAMRVGMHAWIDGMVIAEKQYKLAERGRWRGRHVLGGLAIKDKCELVQDEFGTIVGVRSLVTATVYPTWKFVVYRRDPLFAGPGRSKFRAAYRAWWIKSMALSIWLNGLERDVEGMLKGEYDPTDKNGAADMERALQQAKGGTYIVVPKGAVVEAINLNRRMASDFQAACEYQDKQIMLCLTGAMLQSLDGGAQGSYAKAKVHAGTANIAQWRYADEFCQIINEQIIPDLVNLNFADDGEEYPTFQLSAVDIEEMSRQADLDAKLVSMGLPLSRDQMYRTYNRERPKDEEDSLSPPAVPQASGLPFGGNRILPFAEIYRGPKPPGDPADWVPLPDGPRGGKRWQRKEQPAQPTPAAPGGAAPSSASPESGSPTDAEPIKKFGKSKAYVQLTGNAENAKKAMSKLGITDPADVASLVGAPDGAIVSSVSRDGDKLVVSIEHQMFEATREIGIDAKGQRYIHNREFFVTSDSARNSGIGSEVFGRQVENATAAGFGYIKCHAAKANPQQPGNPHNGYYTWPRLGYDQSIDDLASTEPRFARIVEGKFPNARSILDVMSTKEGRDWWKANGTDLTAMKFDLKTGPPPSRSQQVFRAYLDEREKRKPATTMSDSKPQDEINDLGIAPWEEEALEAAWERIERDGWASSVSEFSDEQIALPAADRRGVEKLTAAAITDGVALLQRVASEAVKRLIREPNPEISTTFFTADELESLAESLAATIAPAYLMGAARVNAMAEQARRRGKSTPVPASTRLPGPVRVVSLQFDDSSGPITFEPVPPTKALEYFQSLFPSLDHLNPLRFGELMRRRAFTLAAAAEQAILSAVQTSIATSMAQGQTLMQATASAQELLDDAGVTPANPQYAEMVYRTNAMDSYNIGSQEELQREADTFPVWRYANAQLDSSRKSHRERDGNYYAASTPFTLVRGEGIADVANCTCTMIPIDKWEWEQLQAEGVTLSG